ncbi:MAG TPA: hypothetical protein DEB39_09050 [Planctomycetaceae bacterium]|nr:hypothetical protein [Planctomycetaceae bacterium]
MSDSASAAGNTVIGGSARLIQTAMARGRSEVSGRALLAGASLVTGHCKIDGTSIITCNARIGGDIEIHSRFIGGDQVVGFRYGERRIA